MKTRTLYMIPVVGLLVLAGVFFNAHPPLAQTDDPCPLPEGVAPPPDPAVTAQQVEAGSASLKDFALATRDINKQVSQEVKDLEILWYLGCIIRQEGSAWRSGSTYIVQLSPDGRVFLHAKDMALSGRLLNPLIYAEILSKLGVSPTVLANLASPDPAIAAQAGAAVFNILSQEPDAPFDATSFGIPGASGYASVFVSTHLGSAVPLLHLAGFKLDASHVIEEEIDYGNPTITAKDVVDRETLKAFVTEATNFFAELRTLDTASAASKLRLALRDPDGPWRHGSVYLYILDLNSNIVVLHGAFPDRFELRPLVGIARDGVTGELILPQVLEAAQSSPEGGFVEYFYDDPNDDTDSADIPKVGYAREYISRPVERPDGTIVQSRFIIGSGFYGSEPEVVPDGPLTQVEATVLGDAIEGLTVAFAHAIAGRQPDYAYSAVTDANGALSLTISSADGVSGYYQARARNAAGETVGQWHSIPPQPQSTPGPGTDAGRRYEGHKRRTTRRIQANGHRRDRSRIRDSAGNQRSGTQLSQPFQQRHPDYLPPVQSRSGAVGDLQCAGSAGTHIGGCVPGRWHLPDSVGCPSTSGASRYRRESILHA